MGSLAVHGGACVSSSGGRTNPTWPVIDVVRKLAVDLRATVWDLGCRFAQWLGVAGDYVSFGEAEIWMHLHDARRKDHNEDFHMLLFLKGGFLRYAGKSTALGVIRVDGLDQPHLAVLVDGEGWEDEPATLVIINKKHMTALRSEEPLTGKELLEWGWRSGIPTAKLPVLKQETIAARLDEEIGKGRFSVEALKPCPICKRDCYSDYCFSSRN